VGDAVGLVDGVAVSVGVASAVAVAVASAVAVADAVGSAVWLRLRPSPRPVGVAVAVGLAVGLGEVVGLTLGEGEAAQACPPTAKTVAPTALASAARILDLRMNPSPSQDQSAGVATRAGLLAELDGSAFRSRAPPTVRKGTNDA